MRSGQLIDLFFDDETYVFARQLEAETIIIAINRENKAKQVSIPVGSIGLKDGVMLKALIGDVSGRVVKGEAMLTLPRRVRCFGSF